MAEGYRQQTRQTVTMRAPPVASPSLGDGLEAIGGALGQAAQRNQQVTDMRAASEDRIAEHEYRRWQSATVADRAGAWAETQAALASDIGELRKTTEPGAPGYEAKVAELTDKHVAAFRGTLPDDPEIFARFDPMVRTAVANLTLREEGWAEDNRAVQQGTGVQKLQTQQTITLQESPDFAALATSFTDADTIVDALDMDGTHKEILRSEWKSKNTATVLQARLDAGDVAGVRAALDSGDLDPYLGDKGRRPWDALASQTEQMIAAKEERDASKARSDAREAVDVVKTVIANGATPSADQWAAAEAGNSALDPSEQVDFAALRVTAKTAENTRGWSASQLAGERDRLKVKVEAGKASQVEELQYRFFTERADAAETAAAGEMKDLAAKGLPGQLEIIRRTRGMNAVTAFNVANKAVPGLGYIARLPEPMQVAALNGRAARTDKTRKGDFGDDKAMMAAFRSHVGADTLNLLGGNADEVFAFAWDIYAGYKDPGQPGGPDKAFGRAIDIVMGARQGRDGVMRGGMGQWDATNKPVLLPSDRSAREFGTELHRLSFAGATYSGDKPASKADVLANYTPVYSGQNAPNGRPIYYFIDASGHALQQKGGGNYRYVPQPR